MSENPRTFLYSGIEVTLVAPWRKSDHSGPDGNCVEVSADVDGNVYVRNSNDPDGPVVRFTSAEWAAFTAGAKDGQFDDPSAEWQKVQETTATTSV